MGAGSRKRLRRSRDQWDELHRRLMVCAAPDCWMPVEDVWFAMAPSHGERRTDATIFALCKTHDGNEGYDGAVDMALHILGDRPGLDLQGAPWADSRALLESLEEAGLLPMALSPAS